MKRAPDGLSYYCRECRYTENKNWRAKNPGYMESKNKAWNEANPDYKSRKCKEWREKNPDYKEK